MPRKIRQQLRIRKGSHVSFVLVGDHIELQVKTPETTAISFFGMLKSKHKAVPADFNVASLLRSL